MNTKKFTQGVLYNRTSRTHELLKKTEEEKKNKTQKNIIKSKKTSRKKLKKMDVLIIMISTFELVILYFYLQDLAIIVLLRTTF